MNDVQMVLGIGFGDEGKGRVVDYLCSGEADSIVVRFSGGHQCGHQVVSGGFRHTFSNFGSGTFRKAQTYWSKFCTVDPIGLLNESDVLSSKGVSPELFIDEDCPVVTPFDKIYNCHRNNILRHGSCGVGFGATLQREEDGYSLKYKDLFNPTILDIKVDLIARYYRDKASKERSGLLLSEFNFNVEFFIHSIEEIKELNGVKIIQGQPMHMNNFPVILEGSQGLLLDQKVGFFPYVTRATVGLANACEIGLYPSKLNFVTRAYQTRHGNGPMTNLHIPHNIKPNPIENNCLNQHQGEFRVSVLDLDLLKYSLSSDYRFQHFDKALYITCLDLIEDSYFLTENKTLVQLPDETAFVRRISKSLGFREVYLSRAPEGAFDPF